jgi:hypothetical protein
MASVLPIPTTPLDSPFGTSIYMRSCSSVAEEAFLRRYAQSPSPASFRTLSSHAAFMGSRKENSPLCSVTGSATSLINNTVLDTARVIAPASPRRSWSWNVPGDHLEISSYDLISRFQAHIEGFDNLDQSAAWIHEGDSTDVPSSPTMTPSKDDAHVPGLAKVLEGKEVQAVEMPRGSMDDELSIHLSRKQNSPFRKWLKALKRRHDPEYEASLDDLAWGEDQMLTSDCIHLEVPVSKHRKPPSSVASTALITAVKTASATMTSLSLYPISRLSTRSYHRRQGSRSDAEPTRSSFDSIAASPVPLDDGTCSRSLQRHRIVEEMVSSEESYIRDLKTLLNVSAFRSLLF